MALAGGVCHFDSTDAVEDNNGRVNFLFDGLKRWIESLLPFRIVYCFPFLFIYHVQSHFL